LYALLTELLGKGEKIITIEDPVEYELPGVLQIPVNDKKGLSFATGLRSILRHDPDRILVGEIRDSDTAEVAVQAALTGHQVYTTVHANDAFDVLGRFVHLGVDLYGFASAVNGVVAQRLVRLNCNFCKKALVKIDPNFVRLNNLRQSDHMISPSRGMGCSSCRGTGFKGRTVISQLLTFTDELREKIVQRSELTVLKRIAAEHSSSSLAEEALGLVCAGLTTLEEVERVVALE
jgi:general secretion pathway protein E